MGEDLLSTKDFHFDGWTLLPSALAAAKFFSFDNDAVGVVDTIVFCESDDRRVDMMSSLRFADLRQALNYFEVLRRGDSVLVICELSSFLNDFRDRDADSFLHGSQNSDSCFICIHPESRCLFTTLEAPEQLLRHPRSQYD